MLTFKSICTVLAGAMELLPALKNFPVTSVKSLSRNIAEKLGNNVIFKFLYE